MQLTDQTQLSELSDPLWSELTLLRCPVCFIQRQLWHRDLVDGRLIKFPMKVEGWK